MFIPGQYLFDILNSIGKTTWKYPNVVRNENWKHADFIFYLFFFYVEEASMNEIPITYIIHFSDTSSSSVTEMEGRSPVFQQPFTKRC